MVSLELIRVAIVWQKRGPEEASRLYFGEQNVDGMLAVLAPLHHILERTGAEHCKRCRSRKHTEENCERLANIVKNSKSGEEDLNQAWDILSRVQTNQQATADVDQFRVEIRFAPFVIGESLSCPWNYIAGAVVTMWLHPPCVIPPATPASFTNPRIRWENYGYLLKAMKICQMNA